MRTDDYNSSFSLALTRTIAKIQAKSTSAFVWAGVCLVWTLVALGVFFLGTSTPVALGSLALSYVIGRAVSYTSSDTPSDTKTGIHYETTTGSIEGTHTCVDCDEKKMWCDLVIAYKVLYVLGYEVARFERARNYECSDCSEPEIVNSDTQAEPQAAVAE